MSTPAPTRRDRVEFAVFRAITAVLAAFPETWAQGGGALLGRFAGSLLGIRRQVVADNLRRAFPERDASWRRQVARESWAHLGREGVAALQLGTLTPAEIVARTEVVGLEAVLEAARGPGAIIATGHLGNWELAGAAVAVRGAPLDALAVRQRNPLFDALLVNTRERSGMRVLHRGKGESDLLGSIRAGRIPVLLADQDAGRRGAFVDFLGHPASTPRGPALLALRSGARLFAAACQALPGHPRRYRVRFELIEVERSGDFAEDVVRLTQAHVDFLARQVREAPTQYFWQHKRWKTPPPSTGGPPD